MANTQSKSKTQDRTDRIRRMLNDVAREVRADADKVEDPRARALFEATGDVLEGLQKAYDHYAESGDQQPWDEPEWQRQDGC